MHLFFMGQDQSINQQRYDYPQPPHAVPLPWTEPLPRIPQNPSQLPWNDTPPHMNGIMPNPGPSNPFGGGRGGSIYKI